MPTGPDQKNPEGLMKRAEELLVVHEEMRSFVSQVTKSKELAARLDEAIMKGDKKLVEEIVHGCGIKSQVTVVRMEADRQIEVRLCAILGLFACVSVVVDY
jgi:replication initiation and membrane attachment protein DnaB